MSGFQGYDQWKTASPYDDEPDLLEEAERFLEETKDTVSPTLLWARTIIENLLNEI